MIRLLPGQVPLREASETEKEFFRARPDVAGMATQDGSVCLNPFSNLTSDQFESVALNEAARVFMWRHSELRPSFQLTEEQLTKFVGYGSMQDIRETVAARILSGDPSALAPTGEQVAFVEQLAKAMGYSQVKVKRHKNPSNTGK